MAQSSTVKQDLTRYCASQWARVLTQMDRDPDSPTYGCFDRNHWHYKIRDFASAILQQGVFACEAVRRGHLALDGVDSRTLADWSVAALNELSRQAAGGWVAEYYPWEDSYPAAAFGLYAAGRVLVDWEATEPALAARVRPAGLQRLADRLAARIEGQALNQQAAGLAGLALLARTRAVRVAPEAVRAVADRLLATQHAEGWFPEYGGPDFGYLTVTLDALTDYHDATGDDRALAAIDRAVAFLASMVGADGRLPSTLNSRNTDYAVPYGLTRAGARSPLAAWLVRTLMRGVAEPSHYLWPTDDRYHSHYVYASCVRALPYLDALLPGEPPTPVERLWLPGCGYLVQWATDRSWTAYVAAHKGGAVRLHRASGDVAATDHGWRLRDATGTKLWATSWWSADWQVQATADGVSVSGACHAGRYHTSSPARHLVLRLLTRVLGRRVIPLLKRAMIFRPGAQVGPRFERQVTVDAQGLRIDDRFAAYPGLTARRAPRQNLRHVASAESFHAEDLAGPSAAELGTAAESGTVVLDLGVARVVRREFSGSGTPRGHGDGEVDYLATTAPERI